VVSVGSRAICWSKRTLEIFDRLGVAARMMEKGVTWQVGRLFHGDREVYSFDLLPEAGHKFPAFINLQQYYVEEYLIDRARDFPDLIDLRFKNAVSNVRQGDDAVTAHVETPDGSYTITADYLLACDGVRSTVRKSLQLDFVGKAFEERFLITDVEMKADFPSERWFWFEPPFHSGQSALLHKQPNNIYRIDLQLGPDADPDEEKKPENVIPRIKAMVGERTFEIDWVSVYNFQCRRLKRFVHNRVIFLGDSAHIVSPFGARGGNGGVHDVDNLCWKLAAVLDGHAPATLLESYNEERVFGADENITNSARSTSFMTPKTATERVFRDEVLALAERQPFAQKLVNSGRLSTPCSLAGFALQTPSETQSGGAMTPGAPCLDAPVADPTGAPGWLLDHLGGDFALLCLDQDCATSDGLRHVVVGATGLSDVNGLVHERYGAEPGTCYLIRPDQHVAACFSNPTLEEVTAAHACALGKAAP
jgi:3-(3-hydroxy-phenyl)propionate hydroxylase